MKIELINKYVQDTYKVDDPEKFGMNHLIIKVVDGHITYIQYVPPLDEEFYAGQGFVISNNGINDLDIFVALLRTFKV